MNRLSPLIIFIVSFALYFVSTEHLIATVRFPTGDEPYYLLMAHSLVNDRDFELTNNFAAEDYRIYYPSELFPRHEAVTARPLLVSKHALGLAVLIVPAYALDGWHGAAHTLNIVGALLAVNVFLFALELSGSRRAAWLVWAALAFAAPLLTYAELIFPEAPAALLILYAYRHLRAWPAANPAQKLLVTLCLAALPWLHARFLFIVAGLALYLLRNQWTVIRNPPGVIRNSQITSRPLSPLSPSISPYLPLSPLISLGLPLLPLFVSGLLQVAYNFYVYDSPLPNYADHSGTGAPAEIFGAFFGIWLDQQWGLLNHAPIYLLALFYFKFQILDFGLDKHNLKSKILNLKLFWPLLITLPYFLLIVQYRYWWGEWCPPARYLMPILPLLAGPLALALTRLRTRHFRVTFAALTLLGWLVALLFALDGRLMYNHPLGKSVLLEVLGKLVGLDLTAFEPSYIMMFLKDFDPVAWAITQVVLTVVWIVALGLIALNAYGFSPVHQWRAAWLPKRDLTGLKDL